MIWDVSTTVGFGVSGEYGVAIYCPGGNVNTPIWTRVRHVPAGNKFHEAIDQLNGTEEYGSPSDDTTAWSVKWDKNLVTNFKFASGDDLHWLIAA